MSDDNGRRPARPVLVPPAAIPILGLPFTIEGWMVQVLLMCKCQQPKPVIILGIPGSAAGRCSSCGRVYQLADLVMGPQTNGPQFALTIQTPVDDAIDGTGENEGENDAT